MSAVPESMGDLLDINVWLALGDADHIHNLAAQTYWTGPAHSQLWFCRHTALGFKRLMCQPAMLGERALTTLQSFEAYQVIRQQARVDLMMDPLELESTWMGLAQQSPWPPRMWPHAYLASFAIAANLRLVSFDRDFFRFEGLNWLHLTPA